MFTFSRKLVQELFIFIHLSFFSKNYFNTTSALQVTYAKLIVIMWSEIAYPANQHLWKAQPRKKPTNLCASRAFLQKCLFYILQSYHLVILTIEWTNLSHVLAAWSAFCSPFTWSRRTTCAKDHRLLFLITHKSTRSENLISC